MGTQGQRGERSSWYTGAVGRERQWVHRGRGVREVVGTQGLWGERGSGYTGAVEKKVSGYTGTVGEKKKRRKRGTVIGTQGHLGVDSDER